MESEESVDFFNTVCFIAKKLEKQYEATSLNFSIQDGVDSGQSVDVI
jgi:diadenosine tetraphosphate (Ap4A) HIT family hydrolase